MGPSIFQFLPILFPLLFLIMWVLVTCTLGISSGWYVLMKEFPNRDEAAILELKCQSGIMGLWVGMRGILNISVCPSGLRFGIMKIFGPLCRDFFVPWDQISVKRKNRFFWKMADLQFGNPPRGNLSLPNYLANKIARVAKERWPEPGPFPEETKQQVLISVVKEWLALSVFISTFLIAVPRVMMPYGGKTPPLLLVIVFPTLALGIFSIGRYWSRIQK